MAEYQLMMNCDLCGARFQFGPNRYAGNFVERYQMLVCRTCWEGSWDGYGPFYEAKILAHLEEKGLPVPERNAEGWLPRE